MAGPYVYALIDPRDGSVFYIGKGRGRRMYQHERDVMRGRCYNTNKTARIATILAAGLRVACKVLARFSTDAEAYKAERLFIARHEGLTNANAGGAGPFAGAQGAGQDRQESPELTKRKAQALLDRLIPYMDWINEKPRSNAENAIYHLVTAELNGIVAMCSQRMAAAQ